MLDASKVYINADLGTLSRHISSEVNQTTVFIDVETDEKDGLVGIGYTFDGINFHYRTVITDELKQLLEKVYLIGHNIKADCHWLRKWGVNIKPEQIAGDTMLMSYCLYGSSRSHSLKNLAKDLLEMEWTTYDNLTTEVIHITNKKGEIKEKKVKRTLDQLPVEIVAEYCCNDVLATYKLYMELEKTDIYTRIELPTLKAIYSMECRGIEVDVEGLKALDIRLSARISEILTSCELYAPGINIGSSKQLAPVLKELGYWLPTTTKGNYSVKKSVLERYKGEPFIDLLLEYSELKKLKTSFTSPLSDVVTLPRIYPTFNQVRKYEDAQLGISTGRLSCANPNLQQIPSRSEIAKEIRKLFLPDKDKTLIVADFSQIEPRVLAHITKDWYLQNVFNTNKDLYTSLIKGTPWENKPNGREIGKTFYLALSYGAQAKKLSKVFKCSVPEAQRLLDQCWENIPKVKEWQMQTIAEARKLGYVSTMFGRKRFLPNLNSDDFYLRASAERQAINTPIQGTAADIMKLAMIKLDEAGYPLQLVVHDEVILSVDPEMADLALDDVKTIMESIVKLDIPLKVEINAGTNWHTAKQKG